MFESYEAMQAEAKRLVEEYWVRFQTAETRPKYNNTFKFKAKSKYEHTRELQDNLQELNNLCMIMFEGKQVWDFEAQSKPIKGSFVGE